MVHNDLTEHQLTENNKLIMVGWLDRNSQYEQQIPSKEILDKLWTFIMHPRISLMGIHNCDICNDPYQRSMAEHKGQKTGLGSSRIYILGETDVFGSPDLIFHYMKDHHYKPPQVFIDALLSSPEPTSNEYQERLDALGL